MGYIDPAVAEEPMDEELEPLNWENVALLLKNVNRSKEYGRLTITHYSGQGKIVLGRWLRPFTKDLLACPLDGKEQEEAQNLLDEMQVAFIDRGVVYYKRDDCPQHFRQYGTGDCTCEPK
ncbi:MAG TPA: hypothetical protein PKD79_01155 [Candidatus Doudnabacteria bacterium]|nr:hypothetical protein [Candidatus Doudnabacteria bacterium]